MADKELHFDKSLRKIEYTFRWTGMNLESSKKTRSQNLKYKIYLFFNFMWLNMDVAGAVCWFVDSAIKGASFTTLTYVAPCITMCFLANSKSICTLISENKINDVLSLLRNLEIKFGKREKAIEKEKIIKIETDFLYFVLKYMNLFNWILLVAFPLMTLSLIAIEYHYTKTLKLELPYHVLYPFDAYDIKYWPIAFIRQIWGTVIVIFEMSGVDYLFYICNAFICIQFKLLQRDISTLISKDNVTFGDTQFRTKFVEIIKWHQELIHAVSLLESIYSRSTLFNFVASSFLICLSGFNVLTMDDKPYVVSFASFLCSSLLQIFTLCYFGDMLMRSSMEVGDAVYSSRWYVTNADVGKELNIIQMRAQKPCKLTAYGYADVNLGAFTKILSTSWSYFALLRTVYTSPRPQSI